MFVGVFTLFLLILRVNAAFLEPSFLKEEVREADLFRFIHDQALPAAAEESFGQQLADLPLGLKIMVPQIASAARKVLPPEWVQQQVEGMLAAVLPYSVGEAQHFTISLPLEERLDKAQVAIEKLVDRKLQEAFDKLPTCTPQ